MHPLCNGMGRGFSLACALVAAAHLLGAAGLTAQSGPRPGAASIAREGALLGMDAAGGQPTAPPPGRGPKAGSRSDWAAVHRLEPGTEIQLVTVDRQRSRFRLIGSDDASVTVVGSSNHQPIRIALEEVREVRARSRHFARALRNGVIIGAVIGAVMIGSYLCQEEECAAGVGVGALFGGVFGAGDGAIIGALPPRRFELVYRAPSHGVDGEVTR